MTNEAYDVVDALEDAFYRLDADRVEAIFADDIRIWHPHNDRTQTKAECVGFFRTFFKVLDRLEYKVIARYPIEGGLVEQHRLSVFFADGSSVQDVNKCFIVKVRDGKIYSLTDYFDPAPLAPVGQKLAALAA